MDATRRPIRVAMIGQKGYPPVHGGIEKHVAELAARLGRWNVATEIYSRPHYSDADGDADLDQVRVRRMPSIPTKHLDAISHSLLATADALWRQPDIVHYHALGPGLLAGLPRWLGRIPTVVTVHGLDWQRDKWGRFARGVLKWGETGSVRLPDRTIVVSQALCEHFRSEHGRETHFIPNGISAPELLPPRRIRDHGIDGDYLLFVGRLVPEKGCHLLLKAWAALSAGARRGRQLVIAGDAGFTPGYVEELKRIATGDVVFLGYVHGPILSELYTNAQLVVLPSTLEGLSITLLEGMSYGRCCLVSDIPPNLEALSGHGVTFRSGEVGDLRERLEELLDQPGRRQELGRAAQVHALDTYSWERVTKATADLYAALRDEREKSRADSI